MITLTEIKLSNPTGTGDAVYSGDTDDNINGLIDSITIEFTPHAPNGTYVVVSDPDTGTVLARCTKAPDKAFVFVRPRFDITDIDGEAYVSAPSVMHPVIGVATTLTSGGAATTDILATVKIIAVEA